MMVIIMIVITLTVLALTVLALTVACSNLIYLTQADSHNEGARYGAWIKGSNACYIEAILQTPRALARVLQQVNAGLAKVV